MTEYLSWTTDEAYSCLVETFASDEGANTAAVLPAWVLWEKQAVQSGGTEGYAKATRPIATINNVRDFWLAFLALPQPSEVLEGGKISREGHHIDTLMFFREGVRPEWEDVRNKHGGHFQFQFKPGAVVNSPTQVDEYWNNLIIAVFGGSLQGSERITGIRFVDKMSATARQACVRIEVWFEKFADTTAVAALRTAVETCMATRLDGSLGVPPRSDVKSHAE